MAPLAALAGLSVLAGLSTGGFLGPPSGTQPARFLGAQPAIHRESARVVPPGNSLSRETQDSWEKPKRSIAGGCSQPRRARLHRGSTALRGSGDAGDSGNSGNSATPFGDGSEDLPRRVGKSLAEQGFARAPLPLDESFNEWSAAMRNNFPSRKLSEEKFYPKVKELLQQAIPGVSKVQLLSQTLRTISDDLPVVKADQHSLARTPYSRSESLVEDPADAGSNPEQKTLRKILRLGDWPVEAARESAPAEGGIGSIDWQDSDWEGIDWAAEDTSKLDAILARRTSSASRVETKDIRLADTDISAEDISDADRFLIVSVWRRVPDLPDLPDVPEPRDSQGLDSFDSLSSDPQGEALVVAEFDSRWPVAAWKSWIDEAVFWDALARDEKEMKKKVRGALKRAEKWNEELGSLIDKTFTENFPERGQDHLESWLQFDLGPWDRFVRQKLRSFLGDHAHDARVGAGVKALRKELAAIAAEAAVKYPIATAVAEKLKASKKDYAAESSAFLASQKAAASRKRGRAALLLGAMDQDPGAQYIEVKALVLVKDGRRRGL